MQADKLTVKSQEALSQAQSLAVKHGHGVIEPTHLLRALLEQAEGTTAPVLQKLGVALDALQRRLDDELGRLPKVSGAAAQARMADALAKALDTAFREAEQLKDEYVSTEHLLLGIAANERDPAGRALREAGATRDALLKALKSPRGGSPRDLP